MNIPLSARLLCWCVVVCDRPRLWRVSKLDFIIMASSFVATLALGVLTGLGTAIAVSLAMFILYSSQPRYAPTLPFRRRRLV